MTRPADAEVEDHRSTRFAKVPHGLIDDPDADRNAILVYAALSRVANFRTHSTGNRISTRRLADLSRVRRGPALYNARTWLVAHGWIEYEERPGMSDRYVLTDGPEPGAIRATEPGAIRATPESLPGATSRQVPGATSRQVPPSSDLLLVSRDLETGTPPIPPKGGKRLTPEVLDRFEDLWEVYPRHTNKGGARESWAKALKGGADPDAVIGGARRFAADPNLPEPQFVPHLATWLNQGRWEDGPLPPRARPGGPSRNESNIERLAHFVKNAQGGAGDGRSGGRAGLGAPGRGLPGAYR